MSYYPYNHESFSQVHSLATYYMHQYATPLIPSRVAPHVRRVGIRLSITFLPSCIKSCIYRRKLKLKSFCMKRRKILFTQSKPTKENTAGSLTKPESKQSTFRRSYKNQNSNSQPSCSHHNSMGIIKTTRTKLDN